MAAQTTDGIQKINRKFKWTSETCFTLTLIYLVNHSETKVALSNGHISPASAKAENDDSDEDKDDDGGNIDGGASGGRLALGSYGAR